MKPGFPPTDATVFISSEGVRIDPSPILSVAPFLRIVSVSPFFVGLAGRLASGEEEESVFRAVRDFNQSSPPSLSAGVIVEPAQELRDHIRNKIIPYLAGLSTKPVICKKDVRECPDGSFVSRQGPDCTFPPCPSREYGGYGGGEKYGGSVRETVLMEVAR